jgi:hypothetical protein
VNITNALVFRNNVFVDIENIFKFQSTPSTSAGSQHSEDRQNMDSEVIKQQLL